MCFIQKQSDCACAVVYARLRQNLIRFILTTRVMAADDRFTSIKDLRPGMKNVTCVFIVIDKGR